MPVAREFLGDGPRAGPVKAPIKRPDDAIGRPRAQAVFPGEHPAPIQSFHRLLLVYLLTDAELRPGSALFLKHLYTGGCEE